MAPRNDDLISRRALNRALLARQLLLERSPMAIAAAIEHVVGMQAQVPIDPYVGLWSRLADFDPTELGRMVAEREAVRMTLLRTTIHLVTARDSLVLWPLLQPTIRRAWATSSPFAKLVAGIDDAEIRSAGREILEAAPRTAAEMRTILASRWPSVDANALAYTARLLLPVVQVPPRGVWGGRGVARWTTLEGWLGSSPLDEAEQLDEAEAGPSVDDLVLRYLGAFGPASTTDARTWSWLAGVREVVERLRPRLRTFRDERGRELFDLPDAPRPDPDTPAPVRLLPEYDNVLLSHDDRSRIVADADRRRVLVMGEIGFGTVLVDGFVAGRWRVKQSGSRAVLTVYPFRRLAPDEGGAVTAEAERLVGFLAADAADRDVETEDQGWAGSSTTSST